MEDYATIEAENQHENLGDAHKESDVNLPRCVQDLVLDSATQRIHWLEDELKKMTADRDHWHVLSKQVSIVVVSMGMMIFVISQFLLYETFALHPTNYFTGTI